MNHSELMNLIKNALNVSGAFDNCFFHTYATFLFAEQLPLPADLFTFKSIAGENSIASELQKRFTNPNDLDLFAKAYQVIHPDRAPISPNFIVEKTLILGFLMREWFGTQMANNDAIRKSLHQEVIQSFKEYKIGRQALLMHEYLVMGNKGVLYDSNQEFLEHFTRSDTIDDAELLQYWDTKGYLNYCCLIATPRVKLSEHDVTPVMQSLGQPFIVYDHHNGNVNHEATKNSHHPLMRMALHANEGHYYLIKNNNPIILEYAASYAQYMQDRQYVLAVKGDENKLAAANARLSLLTAAICPSGHLPEEPEKILLDSLDFLRAISATDLKVIPYVPPAPAPYVPPAPAPYVPPAPAPFVPPAPTPYVPPIDAEREITQAEKDFYAQIELISKKIDDFKKRITLAENTHDYAKKASLKSAQTAAIKLQDNLRTEADIYFKNPNKQTYVHFSSQCTAHINKANEVLAKHRGWKQILGNIAIAVASLGVFYLIAGAINKAVSGNFLFFKTESEKIADSVKNSVIKVAPAA